MIGYRLLYLAGISSPYHVTSYDWFLILTVSNRLWEIGLFQRPETLPFISDFDTKLASRIPWNSPGQAAEKQSCYHFPLTSLLPMVKIRLLTYESNSGQAGKNPY
jgi:hypothetical protein